MKRLLQITVAVVLIWLLIRNVDLRALADALARFQLESICEGIALFLLACGVAASKWRLLWRKATWWEMLLANFASQFYSMILPGQIAGDVVKTFRVGRRFSDTTGVAASVLVDRVTGLVALLILACAGALLSASAVAENTAMPLLFVTVGLVCALYLMALPSIFSTATSVLGGLGKKYSWLRGVSRKLIDFLSAWVILVSQPRMTLGAIVFGIAFQILAVSVNFVVAHDLGIGIGFSDWCWVLGLVSVALLLPITVAGIGVREGAYAGSLSLLGVPIEKAVAISIVVFGITLLGALIGAIVELSSPPGAGERT